MFGAGAPSVFQSFAMGLSGMGHGVAKKPVTESGSGSDRGNNSGSGILGMTEEEIDERVSPALAWRRIPG